MKAIIYISAFLIALLISSCGRPAWEEFVSNEGGFKALFPGEPVESIVQEEIQVGIIEVFKYSVELGEDEGYMVVYLDYPTQVIEMSEPELLLQSCQESFISGRGGRLVTDKKISIDGFPGREYFVESTIEGKKVTIAARAYLAGNRLYQMYVASIDNKASSEDIRRFLNSFKLLKANNSN